MSRYVRFDHVAVAQLEADFLGPSASLAAECVFVNRQNGASYGHSKITRWSPQTQQKLLELRTFMERDLAELFFEDADSTSIEAVNAPLKNEKTSGIGEQFSEDPDAPQG